jgi:formylglycine-generating enzyme required for sulfatase activity
MNSCAQKIMGKIIGTIFILFLTAGTGLANNLSITDVTLEDRDAGANTAVVEFNISWDNSWRNTLNHDAVWVVLKVRNVSLSSYYCHGQLKKAGLNPPQTSPGTNGDLEIYVPSDKTGAFIRRKSTGSGTVSSQNVRLLLDYGSTGSSSISPCSSAISDSTSIRVNVVGVEMVFIPEGEFFAGSTHSDGLFTSESAAFFWNFSANTLPWRVSSENTITTDVSLGSVTGYGYAVPPSITTGMPQATSADEIVLRPAFPKGYAASYSMKYEITEGLYVEFMNMMDTTQQTSSSLAITCSSAQGRKGGNGFVYRNTIVAPGVGCTAGTVTTDRPDRAMGFMGWPLFAAMLDWLALRPMTELEYEKMARGTQTQISNEYAWGTASTVRNILSFDISPEDGREVPVTSTDANIAIGGPAGPVQYTQGDAFIAAGADIYEIGPVRAGIFATSSSTRATAGAGYYGNMELSGNLWEYVVSVGALYSRIDADTIYNYYDGAHGDGEITSSGYAGGSSMQYWPGAIGSSPFTVTSASYTGLRGGAWSDTTSNFSRVANRVYAGLGTLWYRNDFGGRGVRTYDGTDF